ncbi:uncharacterized protein LOC128549988 [Mercenaria mercenaria]|uniref:uncharacterized protein LOC128549988 n=1 Tax=Mercenaria mercenaria TaxID=6596 RepID=UPI00234E7EB0|nr:uncharacterized protein LOC128549988 [Mercenaria mercenaria]
MYNKKGKEKDQKILLQGIQLPKPQMTGTGAPEPKIKLVMLPAVNTEKFEFVVRRKYTRTATSIKCPMCSLEWLEPIHKQYMGYRYCARTETVPFNQWRENLKASGAAGKRNLDLFITNLMEAGVVYTVDTRV